MSSDSGETTVVRTIGRYRAFGELGRGAMGVVYKGFDPLIGRTVALKTLSIDNADAQAREFRERLYREAAAAGALSHPNIVTIYDIIEDGGVTAVAMEFIEGRPLSAIIAERAPLPVDLAVELLGQICSALDYAGSQGIVHRDIKPANILVTSAGRAKVTDFGVARLALSTMTQAGTVLGSPSYMSPEQVRGLSLDGRSDLFSAAVVFFEMITRERPFAGNDIATTMYRIAHEAPTPPTHFNPEVGPGVAAVLERAFAKSPADRFQTGADLVADLKTAASLGATHGLSPALAALATAPPAVPPIVAPIVTLQVTSAADAAVAPAEPVPIPVARSAGPADSGGHGLAPIPGLAAMPEIVPPAVSRSNVELPSIPLPPENGVPAAAPTGPARASGRRSGLVLAGLAGIVIVALGVAGTMFLRGGTVPEVPAPPMPAVEAPSQATAGPDLPTALLTAEPPPALEAPAAPAPPQAPRPNTNRRPAAASPSSGPRPGAGPQVSPAPAAALQASGASLPAAPAAPGTQPVPGRVYQTSEVDAKPVVLTQVAPVYPADAASRQIQDVVVLQVLVDATGRPQTIKLLRGSRKSALLDGAAAAAVRQWTFKPAEKDGRPVACWFNLGVPFPPSR
ncbi:MAG: TonB family protein [Vicinamibacterales bacterium]